MSDDNSEGWVDERRSYFRIDDVVKLSYRVVPSEELPERIAQLEHDAGSSFTVMSSFIAMSQQMIVQLRRIEATAPDVATCIKILDQKLNILGRALLMQEEEAAGQAMKAVNISAGGMVFGSAEPYPVGAVLELKLLLMPEMTGMMIYGEVIECAENGGEEAAEEPYSLRVNFSNIREADRDILIRYLLRCQGKWLQKRRQESERSGTES